MSILSKHSIHNIQRFIQKGRVSDLSLFIFVFRFIFSKNISQQQWSFCLVNVDFFYYYTLHILISALFFSFLSLERLDFYFLYFFNTLNNTINLIYKQTKIFYELSHMVKRPYGHRTQPQKLHELSPKDGLTL